MWTAVVKIVQSLRVFTFGHAVSKNIQPTTQAKDLGEYGCTSDETDPINFF